MTNMSTKRRASTWVSACLRTGVPASSGLGVGPGVDVAQPCGWRWRRSCDFPRSRSLEGVVVPTAVNVMVAAAVSKALRLAVAQERRLGPHAAAA